MSQERTDQLKSIGFEWNTYKASWDQNYEALKKYKQSNGHCRVSPMHDVNNINLEYWVRNQRQQYKKWQAGKHSKITQECIDELEKIGFVWVVYKK